MRGCPLTYVGGHAMIGKCFSTFRFGDYPSEERRSPLLIIDLLRLIALCRASECFIKLRKHSVARHNALSNRGSTLSAVRVLYQIAEALCRPSECSIRSRKYSVARQNALSNCGSTLSRVTVLYQIAEALCRPS